MALEPGLRDEPAALLFVFSRAEHPLGWCVWRVLPRVLAENHAGTLGIRLTATRAEIERVRDGIADGKLSYDEVREWFEERLEP